jgi:hypothetical protein
MIRIMIVSERIISQSRMNRGRCCVWRRILGEGQAKYLIPRDASLFKEPNALCTPSGPRVCSQEDFAILVEGTWTALHCISRDHECRPPVVLVSLNNKPSCCPVFWANCGHFDPDSAGRLLPCAREHLLGERFCDPYFVTWWG